VMASQKYYRVLNAKNMTAWMSLESSLASLAGRESHFISTCYYNEQQKHQFVKTKSVAGVTDVKTTQLWFDFDSADLNEAFNDAKTLYTNLLSKFPAESIQTFYSGSKGAHIIVKLTDEITPSQVKKAVIKLAGNLKTLDLKVYDANRILRAPNTRHENSGKYKIQLFGQELLEYSLEQIQALAIEPRDFSNYKTIPATLPRELLIEEPVKPPAPVIIDGDVLRVKEIDFTQKPSGWRDYKWSLAQGRFEIGNRNNAMMTIAATCRALKYGEAHTEAICLAADKLHCDLTGDSPMDENDLDRQVLDVVFSESWNGGQYSAENNLELKAYCEKYGFDSKKSNDGSRTIDVAEAFGRYKHFKKNSGKFIVDTGIASLNKAAKMTIGQVVGIVAAPSVGKSTLALQILNAMNKKDTRSIFFSYDMYIALVIQKLMQKHTTMSEAEIDDKIAKMGDAEEKEFIDLLKREYGNVGICFESGQSVDDIVFTLKQEREKHGDVNLIVIDYNELISSQNSDSTESSKEVASKLRSLANNYNVCVVVLMQPNKISGGPSDEIKSYRSIKGSSMSEQSLDLAIGLSRPGFDPEHPEDDKFIVANCLKNRYGKLFRLEWLFNGYTGEISDIKRSEDRLLLEEIKQRKQKHKEETTDTFGQFRR